MQSCFNDRNQLVSNKSGRFLNKQPIILYTYICRYERNNNQSVGKWQGSGTVNIPILMCGTLCRVKVMLHVILFVAAQIKL